MTAQESNVVATSLGARIAELGLALDTTQHQLVRLAAAFETDDEWIAAGYATAAHWIAHHLDVAVSTAREWIRIGRQLGGLPATEAAFAAREISYSKVRTLTRIATADNETELLGIARATPAGNLGIALADWSRRNESPQARHGRHRRDRRLVFRVEPDGAVTGSFRLPPLAAGVVRSAVDTLVTRRAQRPRDVTDQSPLRGHDASAEAWPSLAQQRADALVELASGGGAGVETEVVLHVRGSGCALDDGTPLTASEVATVLPSAFVRVLVHDAEGRPINASSRRRFPSTRQRRVVKERDQVCRDCGSRELLEYDHVPPFGETDHTLVDELELRCAPCHARRHGHNH